MKTPESNSKINGEMKTYEETVMKNPKGFSWKKQEFFKLGVEKYRFLKYQFFWKCFFFSFFKLWKLLPET